MSVKLVKNSLNWNIVTEKWNYFLIVQSNANYKRSQLYAQKSWQYTLCARLQNINHFTIYGHLDST